MTEHTLEDNPNGIANTEMSLAKFNTDMSLSKVDNTNNQLCKITKMPEYAIEFRQMKCLPVAGYGSMPESTNNGEFEILEDEIKWKTKLNKADKLDCLVAASCGIITGSLDAFFVGSLSLERANQWGTNKVEAFVMMVANKDGYNGNDLKDAIRHLEKRYKLAADGNINDYGGGTQHHLRDFSHHFSIGGLLCSFFTQFTGKVIGVDTKGSLLICDVAENHMQFIGTTFLEKILNGTINWVMHIVSDMAGSSGCCGNGTGVPGPILSLLKEISVLPFFKDGNLDEMSFRKYISKLFNGTMLKTQNGESIRFDYRTEVGLVNELGRQGIPVVINQCLIRVFYFVRRLKNELEVHEVQSVTDLNRIDVKNVLPFSNDVILRMNTISTGTFLVVDVADAAIRSFLSCKGNKKKFIAEFVLRVNFVNVGTFAFSVFQDVKHSANIEEEPTQQSRIRMREEEISRMDFLVLTPEQIRQFQSIQRDLVIRDIKLTKKPKEKDAKNEWLKQWEEAIGQGLKKCGISPTDYFMSTFQIYNQLNELEQNNPNSSWPYLLALEIDFAKPYQPLGCDQDKEFKKLKPEDDYMTSVFSVNQNLVSPEDIKSIRKAYKHSENVIDSKFAKNALSVAGTAVATAVLAGTAFILAPVIAPIVVPAIAGEALAGLSGAALTSASLAFLGGGALAAGGAGVAGGTAVIAGGGALLGMAGGTGASAIVNMTSEADGYVFLEASKLLCYCDEILLGKCNDFEGAAAIYRKLNETVLQYKIELAALKQGENAATLIDQQDKTHADITPKEQQKILEKCIKYLTRCSDGIEAALNK